MRVLVRSQPRLIPYHRYACASADTVGFIDDTITNVRAGDWDYASILSEQLADRLRSIDTACNTNAIKYNDDLQDAVRNRDLHALTEARAELILGLCGMEFPDEGWALTQQVLARVIQTHEAKEKDLASLR